MAGITIVDGVVSNLIAKALEAMAKAALKEVASWLGAQDELQKMKITMRMIQARVRDAEQRQEDDSSETIKVWLQSLKLVLYRADDLFDEILTCDRQKQRMKSSIFGNVFIFFSKYGPVYSNKKLADEIKSIKEELDDIKSNMSVLNFGNLPAQEPPMARLIEKKETVSFINIEEFIGRDNDQKYIMEMLFDPKYDVEKVTVIPIVGFGGLGKTTLAQLVFNDQRVKMHFDLTKWAYVPEVDNLNLIKRKIYKSFTDKSYNDLSLDQIQQGIRESIDNKKYLLVLDDIWDEGVGNLNDLMTLLRCGNGNQGSKVIVTTRSDVVARVVGTIDRPYMLGTLTDEQSWDLFKLVAFKQGMEDKNPNFTKIGEEIVNMCGNVPLAIKVVGGFLRSKDSEKEWLQARDAQHSKAQLTKGNAGIMDVLKLSYDYLPPALKQCVAYCSLFPKGCRFDREELVYMWMAQGYCEPCNNEIDGDTLYMNMMARGFFQDPEFSDGNVKNCRMHDLLHDLTQLVAGEESVVLHYDEPSIQLTHGLLHVNFNGYKSSAEACSSLFVGRRIRSLISTDEVVNKYLNDLISRMQHLRLLKLEHIVGRKLPDAIGGLMHLRYLYIQSDVIRYLPDSITRLENLQTLDVQHCIDLRELPRDFAKLTSINHLLLQRFPLFRELPCGFGKLTSLQVLNQYIVGVNNGIDSLPVLNYRGKLTIEFKKWRTNCIVEAQRANLKYCDELTSLVLNFVGMGTFPIEEMNEMLMNLELPPNLRHLEVCFYPGEKMPSRWFDGLSKVVSITLKNCWNCTHLGWENLEMEEEETKEVAGNNITMRHWEWQGLTSLRELTLSNIPKIKKLPTGITSLTTLDMLKIDGLNNLIKLPEEFGNLSMLRELEIWGCPKLKSFPTSLQGLTSLKRLMIIACPELPSGITSLTTLEMLKIRRLNNLIKLPEEFGNLSMLRELDIWGCCILESFPTSLQGLTSLKRLMIGCCPELKSLPTSLLSHTSLSYLEIWSCPHLEERYKRPDGEDCHLIHHIPRVYMRSSFGVSFVSIGSSSPSSSSTASEDEEEMQSLWVNEPK